MNPYSDLKAAWHLDRIAEMRDGVQIVPAQVQLILSDLCNQDCHFCAYRMSGGFSAELFAENGKKNPNRKIPTEKAREIIHDCAALGVGAIQFTGGGEPTVHPAHIELFEYAQKAGLETSLVTNGVILREGWEKSYPKMAWVRVSIDAASPAEYASVRRVSPDVYERALDHLNNIAEEIQVQGSPCVLGAGYVLTLENWQHAYEGALAIREAGAHNVRLSAMFSTQGAAYYDGVLVDIHREIQRIKELERPDFKVINLFGDRIDDLNQHAPDYEFCGYQQFNVYIGGNQKVYRCCTTAYTRHGEVGDLTNQSFAAWFKSQEKKASYETFDARSCHHCQFNKANRVINYVVGPEPTHVNFV